MNNETLNSRKLDGYSNYLFTEDGRCYDIARNIYLGDKPTVRGYRYVHLISDNGSRVRMPRHRAVLLAWKGMPPPGLTGKIVVNHLNGIKGDDRPGNLEWSNDRLNCYHAGLMGLSPKCYPVSTKCHRTNRVTEYPSAVEAARSIGISKDAVLYRLRAGEKYVFPEGLQYRRRVDGKTWEKPVVFEHKTKKPICVFDLINDQITDYESIVDASVHLGVSQACLYTALNREKNQPLVQERYLIKYKSDSSEWRTVVDLELEVKARRAVVTINAETGKSTFYSSARCCCRAMNIKPSALCWRLKTNGEKVYSDGNRYMYYTVFLERKSKEISP